MIPALIVAAVVVLVPLAIAIGLYNGLVAARQRVRESWSTADVELQRRHDLIPNLVRTAQGYMTHERELLERVTELRARAETLRPGEATGEQAAVERELDGALHRLVARFEAYPDLRASEQLLSLQAELAHTEDRIAQALRYYNGNVRDLNVRCESFPQSLIAGAFGFRPAEFFRLADEGARRAPEVRL